MNFTEPQRTIYEFTIRPLTKGVEYIEIPTNYRRRNEGTSNFNIIKYFDIGISFVQTAFNEKRMITKRKLSN